MKILIYTDVHWSTYSSIIRSRGEKYSTRLENLIKSVNWAEDLANKKDVDSIVCLGDFFDKSMLGAEEVTALKNILWSPLPHTFLVGNHETEIHNLKYASSHALPEDFNIVDKPMVETSIDSDIYFLPYTNENELNIEKKEGKNTIIFSHNDIAGIRYGAAVSKNGFDINDIESKCDLFINGHLHNGEKITNKIINLGNLSGQNFGEDATRYSHNAMILDTATMEYEMIENPYAFNFYSFDFTESSRETIENSLSNLKDNAVISVVVNESQHSYIKQMLKDKIYRISIKRFNDGEAKIEEEEVLETVNHIEEFRKYVLQCVGESDIIKEELEKVLM